MMTDHRFPPVEALKSYFEGRTDGILALDGDTQGRFVVRGSTGSMGVRVPADGSLPKLVGYSNIHVNSFEDSGIVWNEVLFGIDGNLNEVYQVCCRILERLEDTGAAFHDAVTQSLEALADILATRSGLSVERRIGLFGELVTLLAICDSYGPETAAGAWRGALNEEQDFALELFDVEVKTTTSEDREHWISSPTQLVPSPGRMLCILSIQITNAGELGGWSLPEVIELVRVAFSLQPEQLARINMLLTEYGYKDEEAALYLRRFRLRSRPALFKVDDTFPAVTPERIAAAIPKVERVTDFRYRVRLSGLQQSEMDIDFARFFEMSGE